MSPGSLELLQQVALFQRVRPATLEAIQAMSTPRTVEEDSYFFHEGDPATHLYVLADGRVKMSQVTVDGQQVALRMIAPGMMFGGAAILNPDHGYPASAQALEDSTALAWEGEAFRKLAGQDPALSLNMMDLMRAYVEEMQSRFRELATERVEQRVARALLRLAAQGGKKSAPGEIELSLSRQDLAEMTGTTLYTVSRILSEWERQGLIHSGRESIAIRQPHGLVRIADDLAR
jgi:CRP-like cAMP-binding protein